MSRTKPVYALGFKVEAVQLVHQGERSLARIASDLGIPSRR